MQKIKRQSESGTVLIAAMITVMILASLGMGYMMTTLSHGNYARMIHEKNRAAALAQGAADEALYDLAYKGKVIPTDGTVVEWKDNAGSTEIKHPHGGTYSVRGQLKTGSDNLGILTCTGKFGKMSKTVQLMIFNTTYEEHKLYHKAIYAGNRENSNYTFELTGKDNDHDNVTGDIHIQGDIKFSLNGFATWNNGNNKITATGEAYKVNEVNGKVQTVSTGDDPIEPPNLNLENYTKPTRQYKSWDPQAQGKGRDVVWVNKEFEYYNASGKDANGNPVSENLSVKISREGGVLEDGGYNEWNDSALIPPDKSVANFFMTGYQNHFVDGFSAKDDSQMAATQNFYLGQRNGGTSSKLGDTMGLYGGGHSVITITPEQNNKVYYVDGNLWLDSDGSNHLFFVPGEGVTDLRITIVARGNIYVGDQVFVAGTNKSLQNNIGGSTNALAFQKLKDSSAIALVAMGDGESYNDINKNGKYDEGEPIVGRSDPDVPAPAQTNPSAADAYATGYRGRMEGSGNLVFGDTISGPVGSVEAFLYADRNFNDITADTSNEQEPYNFGNMTAGNHVYLNRNYASWEKVVSGRSGVPSDWVKIGNDYYPPGTTSQNVDNPFVTARKAVRSGGTCTKCGGSGSCSSCGGTGQKPCTNSKCKSGLVGCSSCSSTGTKTCSSCSGAGNKTCSTCSGKKTVGGTRCTGCNGTGYVKCTKSGCKGTNGGCKTCNYTGYRPHGGTSSQCKGTGWTNGIIGKDCTTCSATGKVICVSCNGAGKLPCATCGGDGKVNCTTCGGDAKISCSSCSGSGKCSCGGGEKYDIYARKHSPLRVDLDERIKTGEVDLPGLPSSTSLHKGCWKPVMWVNN